LGKEDEYGKAMLVVVAVRSDRSGDGEHDEGRNGREGECDKRCSR